MIKTRDFINWRELINTHWSMQESRIEIHIRENWILFEMSSMSSICDEKLIYCGRDSCALIMLKQDV